MARAPIIVARVDVGGSRKGFHATALRDGGFLETFTSLIPTEIVSWCRHKGAQLIGVDAPCRWSATGRARPCERELMSTGIWCFATPKQERAEAHERDHYGWMLNGAALFRELSSTCALFTGGLGPTRRPICFETFPHAIACSLAGEIVPARAKRTIRRSLLKQAGSETSALTNIDLLDAGLCALTAHCLATGRFRTYGDVETGIIVVPMATTRSHVKKSPD